VAKNNFWLLKKKRKKEKEKRNLKILGKNLFLHFVEIINIFYPL
jgi:hypothetical protein